MFGKGEATKYVLVPLFSPSLTVAVIMGVKVVKAAGVVLYVPLYCITFGCVAMNAPNWNMSIYILVILLNFQRRYALL